MNKSIATNQHGASGDVEGFSNEDYERAFSRAKIIRDPTATVESVVKAYTMTKEKRAKVFELDRVVFPRIYERLDFIEMKAALDDPTITAACRDSIITALFRKHLQEIHQTTRTMHFERLSDPVGWGELDRQGKYESNEYFQQIFPLTSMKDIRAHVARGYTYPEGTMNPVLTTEGLVAFQITAAGKLAADLHRGASGTMYTMLSEVPSGILSMSLPEAKTHITNSWDLIHQAFEPGLEAGKKIELLESALAVRHACFTDGVGSDTSRNPQPEESKITCIYEGSTI